MSDTEHTNEDGTYSCPTLRTCAGRERVGRSTLRAADDRARTRDVGGPPRNRETRSMNEPPAAVPPSTTPSAAPVGASGPCPRCGRALFIHRGTRLHCENADCTYIAPLAPPAPASDTLQSAAPLLDAARSVSEIQGLPSWYTRLLDRLSSALRRLLAVVDGSPGAAETADAVNEAREALSGNRSHTPQPTGDWTCPQCDAENRPETPTQCWRSHTPQPNGCAPPSKPPLRNMCGSTR